MLEEEYQQRRGCRGTCARCRPGGAVRVHDPRRAEADIPDVREIYNYYVANSAVTFDEEEWTLAEWK